MIKQAIFVFLIGILFISNAISKENKLFNALKYARRGRARIMGYKNNPNGTYSLLLRVLDDEDEGVYVSRPTARGVDILEILKKEDIDVWCIPKFFIGFDIALALEDFKPPVKTSVYKFIGFLCMVLSSYLSII